MTLPHNLRPSLDVACTALGEEIAVLQARGERILEVCTYPDCTRSRGCIWISTHSRAPGIVIFGFTDEENG